MQVHTSFHAFTDAYLRCSWQNTGLLKHVLALSYVSGQTTLFCLHKWTRDQFTPMLAVASESIRLTDPPAMTLHTPVADVSSGSPCRHSIDSNAPYDHVPQLHAVHTGPYRYKSSRKLALTAWRAGQNANHIHTSRCGMLLESMVTK